MLMLVDDDQTQRVEHFNAFAQGVLESRIKSQYPQMVEIKKAIEYSFGGGGKRFRPLLVYAVAEAFAVNPDRVAPWALAIEMIHTYSLIHDDLPCMDNDDERRGRPTCHKVFGESTALLAGDALLTESFGVLAEHYLKDPEIAVQLISLLSKQAGFLGMVGGQSIDLYAQKEQLSPTQILDMHKMKTGALISACFQGAAIVLGLPHEKRQLLAACGDSLGLAFQLADDLLDSNGSQIEPGSLVEILGKEVVEDLLKEESKKAHFYLSQLHVHEGFLVKLIEFNLKRKQ